MVILTYVLSAFAILVAARIEEDVMPDMLIHCYATHLPTKYNVRTSCLNKYLAHLFGNKTYHGLDANSWGWIDSLGKKIHIRLKRQVRSRPRHGLRVRKEIRTLTDHEREDFFDAVNGLKNEKVR